MSEVMRRVIDRLMTSRNFVSRFVWGVGFIVAASVLVIAGLLEPDASGLGTHEQLGLPPCGFRIIFGVPCPGCGLTTAFAHLVRGQLRSAFEANPFGVPLFLVTALWVPLSAIGLTLALPIGATFRRVHSDWIAVALGAGAFLTWVWRIYRA